MSRATRRIEPVLSAMTAASLLASSTAIAAPATKKTGAATTGASTTAGASGSSGTAPTSEVPSTPPAADPNSPDALSDEAIARFKQKDYDGAVDYFERAYGVDPKPNYLFNIGRVYEEAGRLPEAVKYYERFLREPGVDLESREIALQRLRVLRAIIAETTPKEPVKVEPEPEPEPPKVLTPEPEPEPEPMPRAKKIRIAGYSILGVGGAGLILGAAFGGIASGQAKDLANTDGYDNRQELIRVGQTNAKVADIAFLTGGVLALTGLVLVLTTLGKKPKASTEARVLSPMVGRGQVGLAVGGRF